MVEQDNREPVDWGKFMDNQSDPTSQDDAPDFSVGDINAHQFFTEASDGDGQNDMIQARIPITLGGQIDEILFHARSLGLPLRNRAQFMRFALVRTVEGLARYFEIHR